MVHDPYAEQRRRLEEAVRGSAGGLPTEVRDTAMHAPATLPGARGRWAGQVALDATQVTDADLADLRAEGLDDRAIFELTAAAAVGEAGRRLDAALAAMTAKEA
jgi:alkylhydroperoxidase family enzyme